MANAFVLEEIDRRGIMEVCKSSGMQAALGEIVAQKAANANAYAQSHVGNMKIDGRQLIDRYKVPPYHSKVKVLRYTAIGAVDPTTYLGKIDASINNSVWRQIH